MPNTASTMTPYPTQSHYLDTEPTSPRSFLIMPSAWLRSKKYQFSSHWFNSTRVRTCAVRIPRSPKTGDARLRSAKYHYYVIGLTQPGTKIPISPTWGLRSTDSITSPHSPEWNLVYASPCSAKKTLISGRDHGTTWSMLLHWWGKCRYHPSASILTPYVIHSTNTFMWYWIDEHRVRSTLLDTSTDFGEWP